MAKPLSWKWKLTIAFVVLSIVGMGFVLTPYGQDVMVSKIDEEFQLLPESERRTSELADRYMFLAWWRANIMMDSDSAVKMYKDFLGLNADPKTKANVFLNGKLVSKYVSPDGKTGWGPMHPRGPEAFYNYLELLQSSKSSQIHVIECFKYYQLFYIWMRQHAPDHKVHPKFNKYWPQIRNMIAVRPRQPPPGVEMSAPGAPAWDPKSEE